MPVCPCNPLKLGYFLHMIFDQHTDMMVNSFAEQFQPDGANYLYRKGMKAAPIRVAKVERDDFVEAYRRDARIGFWAMLLVLILLSTLLIGVSMSNNSVDVETGTFAIVGFVSALFLWFNFHAWNAPHRALRHRATTGAALTKQEVRRMTLDMISYGQLAVVGIASLYFVWVAWDEHGGFIGWGRFWLGLAGLMLLVAVVQAFRKWRHSRS